MSFAFDIETIPIEENVDRLFRREEYVDPPMPDFAAKYKKKETVAKYESQWRDSLLSRVRAHEESENKRYEKAMDKATLDATVSRVLCIGYWFGNPDNHGVVEWRTERDLLSSLWKHCQHAQRKGGLIYTASGTQFDVRFCFRRSLANGIRFPSGLRTIKFIGSRPFVHESFIDVSEVWSAGEYGNRVKVDALAMALGTSRKHDGDIHGGNFWKMAGDNREECEKYVIADARAAFEMGQRLVDCGVSHVKESFLGAD